jgi:hypothetical protein
LLDLKADDGAAVASDREESVAERRMDDEREGNICLFVRPIASEKKSMVVGGKGEDRKRHGGRKGEGASLLPSSPYDDDTQA